MRNPNARPRYGGSKVRSGCITCKTRHLKCDEKRPFCQRCIKAGRDCGYRDLAAGAGQGPSPDGLRIIHYVAKVPESPSTFPNWTSPEKRSLEFYKSRTSTELAGCMISELWSRCILQVALWQPAVKHAVIALAALHEGFQFHPHAPDTSFAIQQYNRAIRAVSSLELTGKAVDVALLSCMLFVAFESLRGNHKSALRHISGGLGIALAQEAEGRNIYEQHPSWHLLEPVVVFMGDQAMRVCNPPLPHVGISSIRRAPRPLPTAFVSIEEARILIFNHHNEALHYFQNYGEPQHPEEAEQTTQNIRAKEVKIAEYHRFFRRFCTTFDQANFPPSHPEVLILQMYRTVIDLIIGLAAGHDETKWDASHAHFRRIVTLGEAFMLRPDANLEATNAMSSTPPREHQRDDILDRIESSVSGKEFTHTTESPRDTAFENGNVSAIPTRRELQHLPTRPTFTFSHGIITPLNLVCIRCRDPILRRRALRVLQICNRQEGMWDSARFARVADRVIQIEETSAGGAVTDASQIPARARVQELDMFFGPGKHGKIAYTMSTPGPSVRTVEYLDGGTRGLSVDEGEEDVECRSFLYHMSSSRSLRTQGPVSMDRLPRSRRMGALEEACQDGGRVKSFTSAEPFQLREAMSRAENGTSPKGLPYLYPAMRGDAPCL